MTHRLEDVTIRDATLAMEFLDIDESEINKFHKIFMNGVRVEVAIAGKEYEGFLQMCNYSNGTAELRIGGLCRKPIVEPARKRSRK